MKTTLKPLLSLVLALLLALSLGAAAFADGDVTLFDEKTGVLPVIVTGPSPSEAVLDAAGLLQTYLSESFGKAPQIADDADGSAVVLALGQAKDGGRKGGFVLAADGETLRIGASDPRGLKNGVFRFLEELCGVRIYSADVKTVPRLTELKLRADYNVSYVPTLEYADTDWLSPRNREFALANGLNGIYSPIEHVDGGKVNYIWFCHSLAGGIVPPDELFESHPEYYALNEEGERKPTQLCLSNPEVLERAIQDVRAQLEKSYDPEAALNIVSCTQSDNYGYCRCENCKAVDDQYGGQQSGIMLWFVNQIADAVGPDYPDVVFDTFAYQYTRHAPTGIAPRDNVCVRLCSIECCFAHALDDPDCGVNVSFMKDLEDWSKLCKRLYVWDYVTNFTQTLGVFPNFGTLRRNIDVYRAHNVVGIYEEGNYYAPNCNTEFADLRAWELSRNLRDPLTEEENAQNRADFLNAYYGEGAEELGEIVDFLTEHAGGDDGHLYIYSSMKGSLHGVTQEDALRVDALWDAALEKTRAAGNADAEARISRSRISWDYYEACVTLGRFKGVFGLPNMKAASGLIQALKDSGTTQYCEGTMMDKVSPRAYLAPCDWGKRDRAVDAVVVCAVAVILLTLAVAVLALVKKRFFTAALLFVLAVLGPIFGAWASRLFVVWDNLPFYALIDAGLLLCIAGYLFAAAHAFNGFSFFKGKKGLVVTLLVLAGAALPYELAVLFINTLKYHGSRPTYSIAMSALVPMALIVAALVLTAAKLLKKKKD